VTQFGENPVAVLGPQTFGHVGGHRQGSKALAKSNRTPKDLCVNEAAIFATLTPDEVAAGRVRQDRFQRTTFFRGSEIGQSPG
jgi:hypothetical protein